jgi:hypothetical protein
VVLWSVCECQHLNNDARHLTVPSSVNLSLDFILEQRGVGFLVGDESQGDVSSEGATGSTSHLCSGIEDETTRESVNREKLTRAIQLYLTRFPAVATNLPRQALDEWKLARGRIEIEAPNGFDDDNVLV